MNEIKKEDLIFTDTSEDIKNNDAILGTLEGPCADFINSTRNGRHYSEALWEKTFNDPIITELIENGGICGELDHPTDREETDSSRIAIIMREKPTKKNGKLWAKFDILNTPLGKIAYTLAKAGFKLGISSRGSGDVSPNYDGTEEVDEDTYDFKAFDLVLLPAVKTARLNLVTEGLDTNKFNYKKALLESIQSASEDEQKVMKETLSNLNIDLNESKNRQTKRFSNLDDAKEFIKSLKDSQEPRMDTFDTETDDGDIVTWYEVYYDEKELEESVESIEKAMDTLHDYLISWYNKNIAPERGVDARQAGWDDEVNDTWLWLVNLVTRIKDESLDNIDGTSDNTAVDNTKAALNELQEALKENNELANTITSLQEKLSVSYAKEAELQEEVNKYSKSIRKLSNDARQVVSLKAKISSLNEELNSVNEKITQQNVALKKFRTSSINLTNNNKQLLEKVSADKEQSTKLREQLENVKANALKTEQQLNESIADLQNTMELKAKEYSQKLSKANKLVENYKQVANKAVDKYIDSQARILGVTKQEIKNRLSENYTFDEIDDVCESLKEYKLNISKLPFRTNPLKENIQMKATPSKNEFILPANNFGDEVDEQLMNLAGLQ